MAVGACLGMTVGGTANLPAQSTPNSTNTTTNATTSSDEKIKKLEKDNQDLQKRLDALEAVAQKEGLLPSKKDGDPPVSALTEVNISGFLTTSFFHDDNEPSGPGHIIPGYLWDRVNNSFSLNKFKLTIASPPVERSGDKFDAAYRFSMIAGQDAPIVNTASGTIGFDWLREAYLEMNIPVGTGLNLKAGELISLLNYESGDGGAVNNNASQGFQWFFTGNPPGAGIQLGYTICDWLEVKARVQNGLYVGPIDNNGAKTFLGSINVKPTTNIWFNLIPFGGNEGNSQPAVGSVGPGTSEWGGSIIGGWQALPALGFGTELDYFKFHNPGNSAVPGNSPVWSLGLWTTYDFCPEWALALRTEFLSDKNGVDMAGGALGFVNPLGTGQDITSVALTLNYKPISRIKIQPEIRFDHTSWSGGFNGAGEQNRLIFGASASYLY
jgi:Putative beta-barrel porin-2, OmpL-like. bbp2